MMLARTAHRKRKIEKFISRHMNFMPPIKTIHPGNFYDLMAKIANMSINEK